MKKILLVADVGGWIFERHCQEIKQRITEYEFDIAYCRGSKIGKIHQNYDLIYVLDPMPVAYPAPNKTIMGLRCQWLYENHESGAKGLYEHGLNGSCVAIKPNCAMFHVVNQNQYNTFKDIVDKPLLLAQHGVDETCFDRNSYQKPENEKFTIGTSGRKGSAGKKGFDIIGNACQKLDIAHAKARYGGNRLTKEQMPGFYNKLDAYVCMSQSEGLHNPTLEAGAMGLPVVSTRCGAAEQIIEDGVNGFLIDRNEGALIEALRYLKDNPEKCTEMGENMYNTIMENWTWEIKANDFKNMFDLFFELKEKGELK
jgi:glycosyltransferase involved in cell wall biosynthesis